jgi:hypothetical protein
MASQENEEIKFEQVKIGMIAYSVDTLEVEGKIIWVGKVLDLHPEHLPELLDWVEVGESLREIQDNYDLVVVRNEDSEETVYNYNNDPCGVVCFKKEPGEGIPVTIRKLISEVDGKAEQLSEYFESEYQGEESDEVEALKESLSDLRDNITYFQESQGWI